MPCSIPLAQRVVRLAGRRRKPQAAPLGPRCRAILARIALDCSDSSYCTLSIRQIALATGDAPRNYSNGWHALKLLATRGLVEGHWQIGFRLTQAGWAFVRGEVSP